MIDINCDLGESLDFLQSGHDEQLMQYINSANIACGFHAGDDYIMDKTVENALKYNLKIGAHPGFKDKENFGRREIELTENQIINLVSEQLQKLQKLTPIHHVKPHGALYNMAARRDDYAAAIAKAVYTFNPNLILYGLSGSKSIVAAESLGLKTRSEVFADRAYRKDGSLASRNFKNAVLEENDLIIKQVKALVLQSPIKTLDETYLTLKADTICIHSDTPKALEIAKIVWESIQ